LQERKRSALNYFGKCNNNKRSWMGVYNMEYEMIELSAEFLLTFTFHFISASAGFIWGVYLGKKNLADAIKDTNKEDKS